MPVSLTKLLALASGASATAVFGMNYASTNGDGSPRMASDFESYFKTAASLAGTSGITSARLYTMRQGDTADPIQAIEAAISTNTTLLLGMWASGDGFASELAALSASITQYGSDLANLVVGISVGSEDLYRISPTGIAAKSGVGADPSTIVGYIQQVRKAIAGTALQNALVGHVDTWNVWTDPSNNAVIENCDWIGVDEYPFWQSSVDNTIDNAQSIFVSSYQATQAAVGNKPVWVTETGWPISYSSSTNTDTYGNAVASLDNAKAYWDTVACGLFGVVNTWYYILSDTGANPSFGVSNSNTNPSPLFDMTCPSEAPPLFGNSQPLSNASLSSSNSSASGRPGSSATMSSGGGSRTGTGTGSASTNTSLVKSLASSSKASLGAIVFAILVAVVAL